jgi:hypothetical protein
MPHGTHPNHLHSSPRSKRLWLWFGLLLGTGGGMLAGWLIAG